jgi:SPP1 family phage portal protein
MGNRVTLSGNDALSDKMNMTYRKGHFHKNNYSIVNSINAYGDAFEYIYYANGRVMSKVIDSADAYPIYSDRMEYIGFIEHYTDALTGVATYIVYDPEKVTEYTNEGGTMHRVNQYANLTGLPIHYKNNDDLFGRSIIDDLKPIIDKLEVLINRMDDSIYTLSLNPMGVVSGQRLNETVDSEAVGYVLNLEDGAEFKYAVAQLDSASIKLLLDALLTQFYVIAMVPSTIFGQSNTANISEISLKLLYTLADNAGKELAVYLRDGFDIRHEQIGRLIGVDDAILDVVFNYNRPIDTKEQIDNLSTQFNDGAISLETYIEKSPLTENASQELARLNNKHEQ